MKRYTLLAFYLISAHAFASTNKQNDSFTTALDILNAHSIGTLSDSQYFEKISNCSNLENNYCTGLLGNYYYGKKDYSSAFITLQKYFDRHSQIDGVDDLFSIPMNGELGWMYQMGNGVLQNFDKALYYYKKAAQHGDEESAYKISVIYAQKVKIMYNANRWSNKEYVDNFLNFYAWGMVAQTMGYKFDVSELNELQQILYQKSRLNEADNLARKICSSIPSCQQ